MIKRIMPEHLGMSVKVSGLPDKPFNNCVGVLIGTEYPTLVGVVHFPDLHLVPEIPVEYLTLVET